MNADPIGDAIAFRTKNGGVNGPPTTAVEAKKKGLQLPRPLKLAIKGAAFVDLYAENSNDVSMTSNSSSVGAKKASGLAKPSYSKIGGASASVQKM